MQSLSKISGAFKPKRVAQRATLFGFLILFLWFIVQF